MPSDLLVGSGSMIAVYDPPGVQLSIRELAITVLMKDGRAAAADRERVIAEIARYAYDYFIFAGN